MGDIMVQATLIKPTTSKAWVKSVDIFLSSKSMNKRAEH